VTRPQASTARAASRPTTLRYGDPDRDGADDAAVLATMVGQL
jgi:hypothetical protein